MDDTYIKIQRFKRHKKVKLDLSGMSLTFVPTDVYTLRDMKELDLSNNKLIKIDQKLDNLSSLTTLNLSYNNIDDLPSSIMNLKRLKSLNLTGNPLSQKFLKLSNLSSRKLQEALMDCFSSTGQPKSGDIFDDFWDDGNIQKGDDDDFDFGFDDEPKKRVRSSRNRHQNEMGMGILGTKNESKGETIQDLKRTIRELKMKNKDLEGNLMMSNADFGGTMSSGQELDVKLSEIKIIKKISQGGYSIVERGIFRGTNVAIKKIFDPVVTDDLMDEITNEVNMLSKLRHPNIILMMAHSINPPDLFIVFELCRRGSLYDLLHKMKDNLNKYKQKIAIQTAMALQFMHQSGVVHRDIKSLNVLLDDHYNVKLCDFGISTNYSDLNKGKHQFVGTPTYMSPEQLEQKGYNQKVDVFAFGTLLWEIYSEEVPFEGLEIHDIKERVLRGTVLDKKVGMGNEIYDLVTECRQVNPDKRPEMSEVVSRLKRVK